jgi:hypothetical protein
VRPWRLLVRLCLRTLPRYIVVVCQSLAAFRPSLLVDFGLMGHSRLDDSSKKSTVRQNSKKTSTVKWASRNTAHMLLPGIHIVIKCHYARKVYPKHTITIRRPRLTVPKIQGVSHYDRLCYTGTVDESLKLPFKMALGYQSTFLEKVNHTVDYGFKS